MNTAVAFRATTDSAVAAPAEVTIPTNARFARVELTLDARVTGVATFSGAVVTDSSDRPIADAEVSLPGIQKIGLTNERGAFRLADIPAGEHQVNVRRVGYGPIDTRITFASNETVRRRIMMSRSNRLDTVVVTESVLPSTFDEHKKLGLGKFITREELEKARGRRLSEVLGSIQGAGMITGAMGNAYLASARGMSARLPGCSPGVFATFNGDGLKTKPGGAATPTCAMSTADPGNGIYCPEGPQEKLRGIGCGCYAQVYMDRQLLNPVTSQLVNGKLVRATPPFDINSFGLDQVEAIEFYKSASETPGMYAALDSPCGVLVLWTRRSH